MSSVVYLKFKKVTKNTVVYENDDEDSQVKTIYIKKDKSGPGRTQFPEHLKLTIELSNNEFNLSD